jgi:hypothetical protein
MPCSKFPEIVLMQTVENKQWGINLGTIVVGLILLIGRSFILFT